MRVGAVPDAPLFYHSRVVGVVVKHFFHEGHAAMAEVHFGRLVELARGKVLARRLSENNQLAGLGGEVLHFLHERALVPLPVLQAPRVAVQFTVDAIVARVVRQYPAKHAEEQSGGSHADAVPGGSGAHRMSVVASILSKAPFPMHGSVTSTGWSLKRGCPLTSAHLQAPLLSSASVAQPQCLQSHRWVESLPARARAQCTAPWR